MGVVNVVRQAAHLRQAGQGQQEVTGPTQLDQNTNGRPPSGCGYARLDLKLRCSYSQSMCALHFEWDDAKARANVKKHGVSFDEAKSVFLDDQAKLIPDPDHSVSEERFVLLGYSSSLKLLVVCHCYRAEGRTIRLISARKATRQEAQVYER